MHFVILYATVNIVIGEAAISRLPNPWTDYHQWDMSTRHVVLGKERNEKGGQGRDGRERGMEKMEEKRMR